MKLEDTAYLMQSDDFKLRGIAEYYQIKIRTEQNREFIRKWENNELDFVPCNKLESSKRQLDAMEYYELALRLRLREVFNAHDDAEFENAINEYVARHTIIQSWG